MGAEVNKGNGKPIKLTRSTFRVTRTFAGALGAATTLCWRRCKRYLPTCK